MSDQTPEPTAPTDQPPAAPPAPPAPPAEPPAAPPAAEQPPAESTWNEDAYKAEIAKLRQEAAANRVKARDAETAAAQAAQAKIDAALKALGIEPQGEDPVEAATAAKAAADAARAEAANSARLLAAHKAAARAGANVDALLDSNSFTSALNGLDPSDADGITAAVNAALAANPRFKATPAAPQGGADLGPGGQATPRTYTAAQVGDPTFFAANRADIMQALKEGRIR